MTNTESDFVNTLLARRKEIVTCETCGKVGSRYHANSDVQAFYSDGERYYGSPLKRNMGSIIVQGLSCSSCVRTQAQAKVNVLNVVSSPLPARPLRVNEMP